jgi:hypothetical protein
LVEGVQTPIDLVSVLTHKEALNEAHDVELQGNLAFVAGKGGSIAIIDVENPMDPKLIWFERNQEGFEDSETVLLADEYLFLGTRDFHAINISNPDNPVVEKSIVDRNRVDTINGMVRRESLIFAASKNGFLTVFDISAPGSPIIEGSKNITNEFGLWKPHDIDLMGPYAIVADPSNFGSSPGTIAVIRVFDTQDQLLPDSEWELTGHLSTDTLSGANRVQVKGNYAYLAGSYSPKASLGKPLAKGIVVELSDPVNPKEVASVNFPDARGPNGLTLAGNVWFLAGGQTIEAYDISVPSTPRNLFSHTSTQAFPTADDNAHDLVYRNGYLYVTGQGDHRFVIFKIEDAAVLKLAETI